MAHDDLNFLDYVEIRRRVEGRFARIAGLVVHSFIFIAITAWLGILGTIVNTNPTEERFYFLAPEAGHIMALWSMLLVAHGLWTFWRSGMTTTTRTQAIDPELNERLQADDVYLSDDPRDLFRLKALLHEDLRKRSGSNSILLIFTVVNMMLWLPWAATAADTGAAWQIAPLLALGFTPIFLLNFWLPSRQEAWVQRQLEPRPVKRKSHQDASLRLTGDGELIEVDEAALRTVKS